MRLKRFISFLTICLLTCSLGHAKPSDSSIKALKSISNGFTKVAKEGLPAVVFIEAQSTPQQVDEFDSPFGGSDPFNSFNEEFFERFFGQPFRRQQPRAQPVHSQGSGFVVSKDGYILTNNHVVRDASKVTIRFQDNREYNAEVVGTDKFSDIALLKIEGEDFPYLDLADPEDLEVGEWAIAIGSPFQLSSSVTVGIVSAKGRSSLRITDFEDFIQTDAAINPGNSGGPLLNIDGKVIGINTAIVSKSGGYNGIGFAIPTNLVNFVMNQLKEHGYVTRGFLGVRLQNIDHDMATCFKLDKVEGALVAEVEPGSPGEKAGLKLGDVIVEFNGKKVTDLGKFRNAISMTPPGSTITLKVIRDKGKSVTLKAKLESATKYADSTQGTLNKLGFNVRDITTTDRKQLSDSVGKVEGVLVSQVHMQTPAHQRGLRPGMIITQVNQEKIKDLADFEAQIDKYKATLKSHKGAKGRKQSLLLHVVSPNGMSTYIAIPPQ